MLRMCHFFHQAHCARIYFIRCELCVSATPEGIISAKKLEIDQDLTDVLWERRGLGERCHWHTPATLHLPGPSFQIPFSLPLCKTEGQYLSQDSWQQLPQPKKTPVFWALKSFSGVYITKVLLWRSALLGTRLLGTFYFSTFNFAGHWLHLLRRACASPDTQTWIQ